MVSFQGAEFAFELRGDTVRIGSAPTNGLVLRDPGVSQEHAEVKRTGSVWRLVDLESANGTRVNGLYVNKQDLKDGDAISVGGAKLTFRDEPASAPIPISGAAAPAPIPAPAPVQAWTPQPLPVEAAPPRRAPSRDRDDDRDRHRRPRRGGGGGGGGSGGGGWMAGVLLALLAGAVVVIAAMALPGAEKSVDPNVEVLRVMRELVAAGRYAEAAALEEKGNPQFGDTQKEIWKVAAEARRKLESSREEKFVGGGDSFWNEKIAPRMPVPESDVREVARLCDEFCKEFPGHPKADEAEILHLQLTGEASPAWQKAKGGSQPGQGGYVSVSDLIFAAENRAIPFLNSGDFAAAFRVYDMYADACARVHPQGFVEKFRDESKPARTLIEKRSRNFFEKMEERAMTLEDAKRLDEVERMYREARDRCGLPDLRQRCEAELDRLRGRR